MPHANEQANSYWFEKGAWPTVIDRTTRASVMHTRATSTARSAAQATPRAAGVLSQTTEISVVAADRPGLFADLAETMAALGADVTDARVATTDEGLVLDVFQVQDGSGAPYGQAEPRRLNDLVAALERAARREGAIRSAPPAQPSSRRAAFDVRPVVMIDATASEAATIIEVSGADRPGLLAEVSRTLTDHGLSIRSAHVASFGERAVDSFYVVDTAGRKITSDLVLDEVQAALEDVMEHRVIAPAGRKITAARASARDVSEIGRRSRRAKTVSPEREAR